MLLPFYPIYGPPFFFLKKKEEEKFLSPLGCWCSSSYSNAHAIIGFSILRAPGQVARHQLCPLDSMDQQFT
jgi:hypothetical protein